MRKITTVAHFHVVPILAGAPRFSLNIFASMGNEDVRKLLFFSKAEASNLEQFKIFKNAFEKLGVELINVPFLRRKVCFGDAFAIVTFLWLIIKYKPQILNTVSAKGMVLGAICNIILGRRVSVIHTVQGIPYRPNSKSLKNVFVRYIDHFFASFVPQIVCVNREYISLYENIAPSVSYIPNGRDFYPIHNRLERRHNNNHLNILFVGRLSEQKNIKGMLYVIKELSDRGLLEYYQFQIVGDGELREAAENFVRERGLTNYVKFYGWVERTEAFFYTADIFLMISNWEGFGFVFLDAAQFSLPCVASDIEGIKDIIIDGENGFLHHPANYAAIATSIVKLGDSFKLRKEMGEKNFEFCKENFSLEHVIRQYRDLYLSVLSLKGSGSRGVPKA